VSRNKDGLVGHGCGCGERGFQVSFQARQDGKSTDVCRIERAKRKGIEECGKAVAGLNRDLTDIIKR
jgi:hypothetical protein